MYLATKFNHVFYYLIDIRADNNRVFGLFKKDRSEDDGEYLLCVDKGIDDNIMVPIGLTRRSLKMAIREYRDDV